MKGRQRIVLAIVAGQAALAGTYWLIESQRSALKEGNVELSTTPPQVISRSLSPLWMQRRDGTKVDLTTIDRPTLLHFWATWCPPCRDELPGLLALADANSIDVVAVALDRDWADVDHFFGGRSGPHIFLGDAASIEGQLGVRSLPVTFVVEPGGRLRLRFDGARDWQNMPFVKRWIRSEP